MRARFVGIAGLLIGSLVVSVSPASAVTLLVPGWEKNSPSCQIDAQAGGGGTRIEYFVSGRSKQGTCLFRPRLDMYYAGSVHSYFGSWGQQYEAVFSANGVNAGEFIQGQTKRTGTVTYVTLGF